MVRIDHPLSTKEGHESKQLAKFYYNHSSTLLAAFCVEQQGITNRNSARPTTAPYPSIITPAPFVHCLCHPVSPQTCCAVTVLKK